MPLSDHEQRLLEQIERALYAEDPKFASTVRSTDLRHYYRRRLLRAALVLAVGVGAVVAGLVTGYRAAWIAGAVVAALGLGWVLLAWRRLTQGDLAARRRIAAKTAAHGPRRPFRVRMEERWQRRWDERNL